MQLFIQFISGRLISPAIQSAELGYCAWIVNCLLPELPLWWRYYAKNHSAFLQTLLWLTSNITKHLSGSQVLGCFSSEKPEQYGPTPTARTASLARITLKTTQPYFKSYCELHLHYEASFWILGLKLLSYRETIEMRATPTARTASLAKISC